MPTPATSLRESLASLLNKLGMDMAGYDYEEQQKRRNYADSLLANSLGRDQSLNQSAINMSDRGLGRSGIALNQAVNVNQAYDTRNSNAAQDFNTALSDIARKRLLAQTGYNLQKADITRQIAGL